VEQVVEIIDGATGEAATNYLLRDNAVAAATRAIEPLVDAYFGVQPSERLLIDDTVNVIIPSVQPTRSRGAVPTMTPAADEVLAAYRERLCTTLSDWSRASNSVVGRVARSMKLGLAMTVIERRSVPKPHMSHASIDDMDVLATIDRLQTAFPGTKRTLDFVRGLMVFDGPSLYIVKPDASRYWTQSSALNDADEIAGTLLAHPAQAHS
jgi:hypothetical protein